MMWPFRSIARDREHLLSLRIKDLQQQLVDAAKREDYFRSRYEKLADEVLYARGAIAEPVHVETTTTVKEALTSKLTRVANLVGGNAPRKPASDTSAYGLPHLAPRS